MLPIHALSLVCICAALAVAHRELNPAATMPPSPPTIDPSLNIFFTAQFLYTYTAERFTLEVAHTLELSPSAFRIVYTFPYQPASGFAQFYFDPTTAGYAAAAEIAHRLYAQSAGTLLVCFGIKSLNGQPMLPPANTTTTFAPAPTNSVPPTTTGTAPSTTTAAPPIMPTIDPSLNIFFTAQFLYTYTAERFTLEVAHALELSPSAFRIVYTFPYQPASGFAQFYFDPATAGYAAAADIAHRLYAQSAGTLLDCFGIKSLNGQPMLPPANTTTTFAPAPTNYTMPPNNHRYTARFHRTARPLRRPIMPTIDPTIHP
jgi:hypothetical protein